MASWKEFASMSPELAAWGEKRFKRSRVAFLATVGVDGSPRVTPVQPVLCQGHLLLFTPTSSPKAADLKRNGIYAMHSLVDNPAGIGGEFSIQGRARLIEDHEIRRKALESTCYTPKGDYLLFELQIDSALARDYEEGNLIENRWELAYS
jgi:uncharacterized pyridoxamine 5'-phosphate oxidase family protein